MESWRSVRLFSSARVSTLTCSTYNRVPYAALTKTFAHIESTTKRLEKTAFLTAFLLLVIQRSAKGDFKSLLQAVYLCINRVSHTGPVFSWNSYLIKRQLSPDYIGVELGIGESLLVKAIGESTGRSVTIIKADLQREGDLGLVAMVSYPSHAKIVELTYLPRILKTARKPSSSPSPWQLLSCFKTWKISQWPPEILFVTCALNVSSLWLTYHVSRKQKKCLLLQNSWPPVKNSRPST